MKNLQSGEKLDRSTLRPGAGRNHLRRLLKHSLARSSLTYVAGALISAVIAFAHISLLTRILSPHAYGLVSMYEVAIGLLIPLLSLNVHAPVTVQFFIRDKADLPKYIGTQTIIIIISSMAFLLIFYFAGSQISHLIALPQSWLWSLVVVCSCLSIQKVAAALWLAQNRAGIQVIVGIVQNLTALLLTVVFVVGLRLDWAGRVLSIIISVAITALFGIALMVREGSIAASFDRESARSGLGFGIPLIPHELGSISLSSLHRFFIANMVGMSAIGIYSVGFQIATIMNILVESFNRAYVPWLFERLRRHDRATNRQIVRFTYQYFVLIAVVGLGLWGLLSLCLKFIVGSSFLAALPYIPWIIASFVFNGMYLMVTNYILFAAKTHLIGIVTMFTAVLNAALTYIMIRYNGALGAAQAMAVSYLVLFLLTWALSARVFPMPWFGRADRPTRSAACGNGSE